MKVLTHINLSNACKSQAKQVSLALFFFFQIELKMSSNGSGDSGPECDLGTLLTLVALKIHCENVRLDRMLLDTPFPLPNLSNLA